jgi:D-alanyl-D-alanine carboxypeptidase
VTADAQFRIASITKLFVATVVLQLAQENRLRLDDVLSRYVSSFPGGDRITLRHLLNHTSGVPDFELADGFGEGLLADRQRRWRTDEILALVTGVRPDFPPGTRYSYSNTGYVLLGEVIRAVTGATWAAEVRRRIIDPLHLVHTYVAGAEPVPGGVLPGFYDTDNDGDQENVETGQPWPSLETAEGPASAIVSTAADLATFGAALFRGRLLAPASLRQMLSEGPHHPRNSNYGLGVEITRPDYRTTVWGHGGALPGFRSVLWYLPQRDMVIVVLANDWRANPQDLAELVLTSARNRT